MNELTRGAIVTSRIRLARNLKNYRFFSQLTDKSVAKEIINRTYTTLMQYGKFTLYQVGDLNPVILEELKERYYISEFLKRNTFSGAVAVHEGGNISVMINEEDHIREQYISQGGDLFTAYRYISALDRWMDAFLGFSKSKNLGFITACPTNLGTGLRASVMMFLPALSKMGYIPDLYERAKAKGLTIRGAFGEGSKGESCLYQVSNEVTLGRSEVLIIKDVQTFVDETAESECATQRIMYEDDKLNVEDYIFRSLGILTNCRKISYEEFSTHIANVKLGVMLGLIEVTKIKAIDDMLVTARPAALSSLLKTGEVKPDLINKDENRATYVRNCLNQIML